MIRGRIDIRAWLTEELGYEKAKEFSLWALGPDYEDTYLHDVPKKWNKLHGDLFQIHEDNDPFEDLWKMIKAWEKS